MEYACVSGGLGVALLLGSPAVVFYHQLSWEGDLLRSGSNTARGFPCHGHFISLWLSE